MLALGFLGCSAQGSDAAPPTPDVSVDIGVGGGADGLEFESLAPGAVLPLHTFGQGGTHALLAVRCSGLGDRAFVNVSITDPARGIQASAPAGPSPRLLACDAKGVLCDLLPILVMTGGLVPPDPTGPMVPVQIHADARNPAGIWVSAEREARLDPASLE